MFDLTTELHNRVNELTQLKDANVRLAADFAKAQEALHWFGINYKSDYKAKQPPDHTQGVVLDVRQQNLVEIDIGTDNGLRKGHKLEVMGTGGGYVGRIEVTETTPDRAVCRVIPDMLRRPMQRGDRVFRQALWGGTGRGLIANRPPTCIPSCWCSRCLARSSSVCVFL